MLTFCTKWWNGKKRSSATKRTAARGEDVNDMELEVCKESAVPGTKTAEQEDDNEQLDAESEEVQVRCRAWELSWPTIAQTLGKE